jgi:O-antigen ligase
LGIGPGNFSRLYYAAPSPAPGGRPDSGTRKRADFYVETLANLGLAGVLVLVWLAVALVRLLRTHAKAGNLLGLGAGVAAGAFFVHGAFDSLFEFMPPLGPFWVLLGVTVAARAEPPSDGAPRDNRG